MVKTQKTGNITLSVTASVSQLYDLKSVSLEKRPRCVCCFRHNEIIVREMCFIKDELTHILSTSLLVWMLNLRIIDEKTTFIQIGETNK